MKKGTLEERREYFREYHKKYAEKNREKLKEKSLAYYYANKDKCNERAKKWAKDNIDVRRATQLKWQRENKRKVKEYNDKFNNGEKALALKENSICEWCGAKEDLCIHHKDNKGHSIPRSDRNNQLNNLMVLCRSCHMRLHRTERLNLNKFLN